MTQEEVIQAMRGYIGMVERDVYRETHHIEVINYSSPMQPSFEVDGIPIYTQSMYSILITVVKNDII